MSTDLSYAFDIISRTSHLRIFSQRATSRRKLPPSFAPHPAKSRAAHVGAGTGHRARAWNYVLDINQASKSHSSLVNVRPRVARDIPIVRIRLLGFRRAFPLG
jgi:hypothetical protein